MSYPSLACDVDISLEAEHEAELWRLPACLEVCVEDGRTPSPRSPGERVWEASDAIDALLDK